MITHKISLDYQQLAANRQVLNVKQYDYLSREVVVTLTDGGTEYTIPDELTEARLAFRKDDDHGGVYSQIEGQPAYTIASDRHSVTIILHPQTMTRAGIVECELQLIGTDVRLSTFRWQLNVEASAAGESDPSEDYYSVPGIHGLPDLASLSNDDEIAVYDVSAGATKKVKASQLGGGGGTTEHNQLSNRDAANSHPMSAIAGLIAALAAKYAKPADGIPATDFTAAVQAILNARVARYYNGDITQDGTIQQSNLLPNDDIHAGDVILAKNNRIGYIDTVSPLTVTLFAGVFLNVGAGGGSVETVNGVSPDENGNVELVPSDIGAYVKPDTGIPLADLAVAVQTSIMLGASAYHLPDGGIPESDLASAVKGKLSVANPAGAATATLSKLNIGGTIYSVPQGGGGGVTKYTVTISGSAPQYTASMTSAEIYTAVQGGNIVEAVVDGETLALTKSTTTAALFVGHALTQSEFIGLALAISGNAALTTPIPIQPKSIADTAGYFTSDTVEGALAEIGAQLNGLETALDGINDVLEGAL